MRERTAELHRIAERSGAIAAMLSGHITQPGYALYLRNLLPAYQAMEQALRRRDASAGTEILVAESLYRAERIEADLHCLAGADWPATIPLLPSAMRYAARVSWAACHGDLLIAHVYTRYLGDLNGGRILARLLVRRFGVDFRATAFMEFPVIEDISAFAMMFRRALDRAGDKAVDAAAIVQEAATAFEMNIQLSQDVNDNL